MTPHMKAEARSLVRRAIDQPAPEGIRERAVRINSVDSGLALGDLTEVVRRLKRQKGGIELQVLTGITTSFNRRICPPSSFPRSIPRRTLLSSQTS